jgi:N-acetylmuramoyl-L-alanine amidase
MARIIGSTARRPLATVLLATIGSVVGCAAQPRTAATPAPTPITFRAPSDIRPPDSAFAVAPMPTAVVVAPPAAGADMPAGPWAPPVKSRVWKFIVLHHSASPTGNAAAFDREHKEKGWDELGYHFVIDNGRGGPDGNIEMGPRWKKQKWGAHAKTPDNRYNDFGIGICLVGNFETGKPTAKQMQSAEKLVAWLMRTYDIPAKNVLGHEDTGRQTLCPGRFLNVASVRTLALRSLADAGIKVSDLEQPANARIALSPTGVELLKAR